MVCYGKDEKQKVTEPRHIEVTWPKRKNEKKNVELVFRPRRDAVTGTHTELGRRQDQIGSEQLGKS